VTLAQLASLLGISEAELIAKIEALPSNGASSVLLSVCSRTRTRRCRTCSTI
jgi:hypothetical protein